MGMSLSTLDGVKKLVMNKINHLEIIQPYISEKYQLYITVDYALKLVIVCDYIIEKSYIRTCGRLRVASSELILVLEQYFNIKLKEYGVETSDSLQLINIDIKNKMPKIYNKITTVIIVQNPL